VHQELPEDFDIAAPPVRCKHGFGYALIKVIPDILSREKCYDRSEHSIIK
jgi:hypothetical protein